MEKEKDNGERLVSVETTYFRMMHLISRGLLEGAVSLIPYLVNTTLWHLPCIQLQCLLNGIEVSEYF